MQILGANLVGGAGNPVDGVEGAGGQKPAPGAGGYQGKGNAKGQQYNQLPLDILNVAVTLGDLNDAGSLLLDNEGGRVQSDRDIASQGSIFKLGPAGLQHGWVKGSAFKMTGINQGLAIGIQKTPKNPLFGGIL